MNDKKLIRRALLGDKQAQRECTEKEIILPCPICGGKARLEDMGFPHHVYCERCGLKSTSVKYGEEGEKDAVKKWNTRTAPPVGRCGRCKWFYESNREIGCTNPLGMYQTQIDENDFCSCFEPKTKPKNQTYKPAELIEDKTSSGLLEE